MSKVDARPRSVRELLSGVKYSIDYYQREYKWETKQIQELLDDLEQKFLISYDPVHERAQVQTYPQYFLGSIVISHKKGQNFIIDGQQRLTSLTLLLIYLNNLQRSRIGDKVAVDSLIFSERYGKKSFNLDVPERTPALEALYHGKSFDATGAPESIQNIVARYADIAELLPESLASEVLPYFIDWLLDNVLLAEITAFSDEDAYTIFETMNDRGRPLSPADMLKGYLLANIQDDGEKAVANALWKGRLRELVEIDETEETDFFKAWFRAKFAETIRERKKGSTNKDFERIDSFHKWLREERDRIGLKKSADFREFVNGKFDFFSKQYLRVSHAALSLTPGLEHVYYNDENHFTLQYSLVLAPLQPQDDQETVDRKIRLVAAYLDIFIARRVVNYRTLGYSSIVYTMFNLMKDIRGLDVIPLAELLKRKVAQMEEKFDAIPDFGLNKQNPNRIHLMLARITRHIEEQCGVPSSFEDYTSTDIKKPFEIEHIWADKHSRYATEFSSEQEFQDHRNRFGGLVLLPRGFNQSLGDDTYEKKVRAYFGQNLLAKSLNSQCYQNNPSFLNYVKTTGLPFKAYPNVFTKRDLAERQELYRRLCEEVWTPKVFDREIVAEQARPGRR